MFNCLDTFELDRLLDEVIPSIPSTTSILIIANFSDQDELSQSVNPAHIFRSKTEINPIKKKSKVNWKEYERQILYAMLQSKNCFVSHIFF